MRDGRPSEPPTGPLPEHCPCPIESYCDLRMDRCVAGCLEDEGCAAGRICEGRACRDGCRGDDGCAAGSICEGTTCRAGCRADGDCADGAICDGSTCRGGCRRDGDCASGNICEATACRVGCRNDADCGGELCDPRTLTCRGGCRSDDACPLGQLCDLATNSCAIGCASDARCRAGEICEGGGCRAGCRTDDVCPLGQHCSADLVCADGCARVGASGATSSRCPVGQACNPYTGSSGMTWRCEQRCTSWSECHSEGADAYECVGPDGSGACRRTCETDGQCRSGEICQWFTERSSMPGSYRVGVCARPCASDVDCDGTVDSYGEYSDECVCKPDGHCRWTDTYVCYQTSPFWGL